MKLSLVVTSPGKSEGKIIPITLSQFLIGRDPQCHLRPASPLISNRHCALLVRSGKAFLRDFDSTNGTFINDEQVKGEKELHNKDCLKVGPIAFTVKLELTPAVAKPTAIPQSAAPAAAGDDDESIAHMMLSLQDDGVAPSVPVGDDGIPLGSTVFDMPAEQDGTVNPPGTKPEPNKKDASKKPTGNTSTAAKAILEKYTRRQRSQ